MWTFFHAHVNRQLCSHFSALLSMHIFFTRKKSEDTYKATFVFNGHLSVLLTQRMVRQWITFNAFFGPFNKPNKRRLLLTRNLPSSDFTQIILSKQKLLYYIICLCVSISLYFLNKKEYRIQYMNIRKGNEEWRDNRLEQAMHLRFAYSTCSRSRRRAEKVDKRM